MTHAEQHQVEMLNDAARLTRVAELVDAIRACHPEDAALVLAAFLEELRRDDPLPYLIADESDAAFWASLATFDQLRATFIAAGRQLVSYPLGLNGRRRMIVAILDGMPPTERAALLAELAADHGETPPG